MLQIDSIAEAKLLVIAAVEEELADLRAAFPPSGLAFAAVGCGLVQAAMNSAAIFSALKSCGRGLPGAVVFVGSCGSYDHSVPLLTPAVASAVLLGDSALALGRGYFPKLMAAKLQPDASLAESILRLEPRGIEFGVFANPLAVTSDQRLGTILRVELGARFENLELFGVAAACAADSIPWTNLSLVTNHVHRHGHNDWNDNRTRASKFTAAMILNWISRTAILTGERTSTPAGQK